MWGETDEGTGAARLRSDTRGVQWTLEAFLAVLLLLSAVVAVAAVVPTGTQQATAELTQERLQAAGADVLTLAQQEGRLEAALLHYDTAEGSFVGTDVSIDGIDRYSTFEGSEHPLAPLFAATLAEQRISYNVDLVYDTGGNDRAPAAGLAGSTGDRERNHDRDGGTLGRGPTGPGRTVQDARRTRELPRRAILCARRQPRGHRVQSRHRGTRTVASLRRPCRGLIVPVDWQVRDGGQ